MTDESLLCVAPGRVIVLRYLMFNRHGELIEDRTKGEPVSYLHGTAAILPSLQTQLEGMRAGDDRSVYLTTSGAEAVPELRFELQVASVRSATPEEIMLGYPLPVASSCGPDCDCFFDTGHQPSQQPAQ